MNPAPPVTRILMGGAGRPSWRGLPARPSQRVRTAQEHDPAPLARAPAVPEEVQDLDREPARDAPVHDQLLRVALAAADAGQEPHGPPQVRPPEALRDAQPE